MNAPLASIPLLPLTAALLAGAAAGVAGAGLVWAALPAVLAVIALLTGRRYIAATAAMAALGLVDVGMQRQPTVSLAQPEAVISYSGVVRDMLSGEGYTRLDIEVDSVSRHECSPFLMALYVTGGETGARLTSRVRFEAKASVPVSMADLPDEIEPDGLLIKRGVSLKAYVPLDNITSVSDEPGLLNAIRRQRDAVSCAIYSSGLNDEASTLLALMLTGDDAQLPAQMRDGFSRAGMAHVLALSGLHIGIIAWIVSIALTPLYLTGHRRSRAVVTVAALWAFAVMTGMSASVVRAVVMATVLILAAVSGRRHNTLNSLCLAAMVIVTASPRSIVSPGFQLSFLAVASIAVASMYMRHGNNQPEIVMKLKRGAVATLAAMVGTGLLGVFYFHIFPVYFMISNLAAMALVGPFICSGLVLLVSKTFGIHSDILIAATDTLGRLITGTGEAVTSLPGAYIEGIDVGALTVVTYFAVIGLLLYYLADRRTFRLVLLCAVTVSGLTISFASAPTYAGDAVYITRNKASTDIVVQDRDRLMLISTASTVAGRHDALSRARRRYSLYMTKRGIDSVAEAPVKFSTPLVSRNNDTIAFGDYRIVIVANNNARGRFTAPHLLICKGYRGDVVKLARDTRARRVILSSDLSSRRHDRYLDELQSAGIAVHSLRRDGPICQEGQTVY